MPTNLTLTEPANIIPEADSQHHHWSVNGLQTKLKKIQLIPHLSELFNYPFTDLVDYGT